MKKSLFLTPFAVFAAIGMTGCSTSVISEVPESPEAPSEETKTIKVNIVRSNFTRADDTEMQIENLYIAFYKGESNVAIAIEKADGSNASYSVQLTLDPFNLPDKMIAFANIENEELLKSDFSQSSSEKLLTANGAMIMSNASYFDSGESESRKIFYNTLSHDNLFNESPIEITLDRIAAKIAVEEDNSLSLAPVKVDGEKELNLRLEGWGITATDKSTFLIKQFPGTYSELSSFLGEWEWNNQGNKTFHWAKSVSYDSGNRTEDIDFITLPEASQGFGNSIYTHESTRSNTDESSNILNPAVVLAGQYYDGESKLGTFYRFRNNGNDKIYTEEEYLSNFATSQDILFTRNDDTSAIEKASVEEITSLIGLSTPSQDVTETAIPDHFVSPQVKTTDVDQKFCDAEGSPYDLQRLNTALFKKYNLLEKYHDGKCLFIVPVIHKSLPGKTFFGLVRNHSYVLAIKNISGFGRGIASENSKIMDEEIPEMPSSYTINTTLLINDWHEIEQEIDIQE